MTWFRLDDQGAFHEKVVRAGNETYGAWCRAGQWSSARGTDGRIPIAVADTIAPRRVWTRAIAAGLIEPVAAEATDYQIHDFLDWNPSAEKVEADRLAWVERQKKSRGARRNVTPRVTRDNASDTSRDSQQTSVRPDPDPRSPPTPSERGSDPAGGRRADGTHPRALGTNPRSQGEAERCAAAGVAVPGSLSSVAGPPPPRRPT